MTSQHNAAQNPYAPPAAAPRGTTAPVTITYYASRPRRRWHQFSLAVLLAVVTTICLTLGVSLTTYPWLLAASNTTLIMVLAGSLVAILAGTIALVVIRRLSHA